MWEGHRGKYRRCGRDTGGSTGDVGGTQGEVQEVWEEGTVCTHIRQSLSYNTPF